MIRNSDKELTMFILKSSAALSTDLHNLSVEDAVEHNLDMMMVSLRLQDKYEKESEVIEGIVAFGLLALENQERHPLYKEIVARMTSILNKDN